MKLHNLLLLYSLILHQILTVVIVQVDATSNFLKRSTVFGFRKRRNISKSIDVSFSSRGGDDSENESSSLSSDLINGNVAVKDNGEEGNTDNDIDTVEFTDTNTQDGLNEEVKQEREEIDNSLIFAASKNGDGSESDPDGLPTRFLRMQKGDREKAKTAFAATVQWRNEHQINTILARPHPKFDICTQIFPIYIPGLDLSNNIIIVQRVGMIDFDIAKRNNITPDDILLHYVYIVEYCWNILEPGPQGVMTTVMDLKNVRFSTFTNEMRSFLKRFVKTMSDHYPQRSHKTLIINAPSWVKMAYGLVKPLLRESTKQKITLFSGGETQDRALIEILGKDSVPREILVNIESLGLSNEEEIDTNGNGHNSEIETELRLFVSMHLCFLFTNFFFIICEYFCRLIYYCVYLTFRSFFALLFYFLPQQCLKQLEKDNEISMQSIV